MGVDLLYGGLTKDMYEDCRDSDDESAGRLSMAHDTPNTEIITSTGSVTV
jgi:hypothetical protein